MSDQIITRLPHAAEPVWPPRFRPPVPRAALQTWGDLDGALDAAVAAYWKNRRLHHAPAA